MAVNGYVRRGDNVTLTLIIPTLTVPMVWTSILVVVKNKIGMDRSEGLNVIAARVLDT